MRKTESTSGKGVTEPGREPPAKPSPEEPAQASGKPCQCEQLRKENEHLRYYESAEYVAHVFDIQRQAGERGKLRQLLRITTEALEALLADYCVDAPNVVGASMSNARAVIAKVREAFPPPNTEEPTL